MSEQEGYTGRVRAGSWDEVLGENEDGTLRTRELPGTRLTIDLDEQIPIGLCRCRVIFEQSETTHE